MMARACGKTRVVPQNGQPRTESTKRESRNACVVLTCDSRGGVEPLLGLAVRLRALGSEVRVCAPPDCAERVAEVGVPLVPAGPPVRPLVHGATPPSAADLPRWRGRSA